ncbi:MAG: class I SAM-dependent methyltransferase [Verrucomicrobiia bacterium]
MNWIWNEFHQTGRDYTDEREAGQYDQSHADFRDMEAEALEALHMLEVRSDGTLLDLGCGTGSFLTIAAGRCRKVIGADVSEAMLALAREKAARLGRTNVQFVHEGFLTYHHNGDPLDAVATTYALHHLPDYWQAVALRRIYGMLRSGGRFYLRDVVIPDAKELFEPVQGFINEQAEAGGDFLREDAEGHFREEFSTFDWVMEGMLTRAGFTILNHRVESRVISTYLCLRP